ncbi:NuA4 histone H4 acetyltransferase complex and the SWR1 complex subunit [Rhizophlyctis rosea]|uniref:Protein AF-9 homolog n=1 Tax=Rhizophlyctis rosea TaxID=64517 RepID=A0AAD5SI50_9FUNG|nr:NuA4 histone H4 acetyltransferase complex and the SWR1 complex subunit [Rhizophlyctis rosea]
MSGNKRMKGVMVVRPFIYGSHSAQVTKRDTPADPSHTHKWTVYVRGLHNEDISYMIKKVQFKLHDSFASPVRIIESHPFEVTETGWGEFEIEIQITFHENLKQFTLYHFLALYHKDNPDSQSKKAVIAESYDEAIFNEPTEDMFKTLEKHPVPPASKKNTNAMFTPQAEQEELRKIAETQKKVLDEIDRYRALIQAEQQRQKAKHEAVKMETD